MERFVTILDALDHWAEVSASRNVFSFIDGRGDVAATLSFAQLQYRAKQLAAQLHQTHKVGERVVLLLPTGPEFVVAFFACLYAGVLPVPLSLPSRHNGIDHLRAIIKNCGAKQALVDPSFAQSLRGEEPLPLSAVPFALAQLTGEADIPRIKSAPTALAFLQYTSGSTSLPKGVTVTHGNIIANQRMINEVFGHNRHSRQLSWMPLYHDMGLVGHVFQPVYNGSESYLMDPALFVQRPRLWLQSISRYRITSTGGPNFCYQHCVKRVKPDIIEKLDFSSLEVAYNGAEPVRGETMRQFTELCAPAGFKRDMFLPCFGLAEATLMVSGVRHNQTPSTREVSREQLQRHRITAAQSTDDATEVASLGRVADGETLSIVDPEAIQLCAAGQVGEIWVAGANVTQGYWRNAEATASTYVWYRGKRYLRTGDLGFVDAERHLYVTGRLKELIIVDGKNHYPQDIEATAQQVDSLLRPTCGAAFTISGADGSEQLVLVQELERRYRRCADGVWPELALLVKTEVSLRHAVTLHTVLFVAPNTVPKTTSGKVRRRLVKQLYLAGEMQSVVTEGRLTA